MKKMLVLMLLIMIVGQQVEACDKEDKVLIDLEKHAQLLIKVEKETKAKLERIEAAKSDVDYKIVKARLKVVMCKDKDILDAE